MSLWDFSDVQPLEENSTDSIKNLVKRECEALKKFSKNKVFAKFGKIKSVSDALAGIEAIANVLQIGEIDDPDGVSTSSLDNANKLYGVTRYGFEIYNSHYKFRVFEVSITPTYPITLSLDSDIYGDEKNKLSEYCGINEAEGLVISSVEDFTACFEIIINNRKVKYIISRMIGMNDDN